VDLVPWLLREVPHTHVPEFDPVERFDAGVRSATYAGDGMLIFYRGKDKRGRDKVVAAIVYEVQRAKDLTKLATLKLYVGHLEAVTGVEAVLVLFIPDRAVANWIRKRIAEQARTGAGPNALIITSDDVKMLVDPDEARAHPERVLFSALYNAQRDDIDQMCPAIVAAFAAVDPRGFSTMTRWSTRCPRPGAPVWRRIS
jgi:hypothetical protein